jgi:hypothetical protein
MAYTTRATIHSADDGGFVIGGLPDGRIIRVSKDGDLTAELAKLERPNPQSFVEADGAVIIMLAMPITNIKEGDRFAVMDKSGEEVQPAEVFQVATQVSLDEIRNMDSWALAKRYGVSGLVSLFNNCKTSVTGSAPPAAPGE